MLSPSQACAGYYSPEILTLLPAFVQITLIYSLENFNGWMQAYFWLQINHIVPISSSSIKIWFAKVQKCFQLSQEKSIKNVRVSLVLTNFNMSHEYSEFLHLWTRIFKLHNFGPKIIPHDLLSQINPQTLRC